MHSYLQITQSFGFCHLRVILKHTVTFYNHRIPIRASDQSVSSQGKCFRTFLPKSQTISHTIKLSSNTVYCNDTKSNCLTFPAPQMADQRFKSRFFSPALEALRLPPNCLSNSASTNPQTKLPFQLAWFLYCHLNVIISIQRYVHLPHLGLGVLVPGRKRPRILPNILQCAGQLPTTQNVLNNCPQHRGPFKEKLL